MKGGVPVKSGGHVTIQTKNPPSHQLGREQTKGQRRLLPRPVNWFLSYNDKIKRGKGATISVDLDSKNKTNEETEKIIEW